jgi:hypothetical protein
LLLPINRESVTSALSQLKLSSLLGGYRNKPGGDIEAIIDAVICVAEFVQAREVIELDINPLLVLPQGKGAIAVDVLVKLNE